jgi:hypothetical protein
MPIEVRIGGETVTLVPENGRLAFEVDSSIEVEADPNRWILKAFNLGAEEEQENQEE